jgi:hypothetical protein
VRALRFVIVAAALLVAACQTTQQGYVLLHAGQAPLDVAENIANKVGTCWFKRGSSAFKGLSYAPELSSPDRPRVLIVKADDPGGLPQLVIEAVKAKRGTDIRLFGPLMATDKASRIRRDVAFWAGGGHSCR